jgi:heterodisulfide reductase subunit C|uniref:Heterodisulfide reductase subunit C n=1 Tax=Desulfobacca acetoxidans TaxID=60893 RepID=A0A7C3SLT7_9BACT
MFNGEMSVKSKGKEAFAVQPLAGGGNGPSAAFIEVDNLDREFAEEVERRSQAGLRRCYFCRSCGNGCPFVEAMDLPPYGIMRLVHYGLREKVLAANTIWICANCHTCSSQCPMAVDIAAMMNTLCQMALEERAKVAAPDILNFHLEVVRSIERHGRTHKLGIMLRLKLLTGEWFKDMDIGLMMLAKRKLDLRPSRIRALKEIHRLFLPYWKVMKP